MGCSNQNLDRIGEAQLAIQRPLTDDEGEVFDLAGDDEDPEWTEEDFAKAIPSSALPAGL
jgi:hypothetical protein